eukprot:856434-Amphidinium_carterae.1
MTWKDLIYSEHHGCIDAFCRNLSCNLLVGMERVYGNDMCLLRFTKHSSVESGGGKSESHVAQSREVPLYASLLPILGGQAAL